MRCLARNMRTMWLSHLTTVELTDEDGNRTGERVPSFTAPIMLRANVSAPTGDSSSSPFGTSTSYDMTVVMADNAAGVTEGDRVWVSDAAPSAPDGGVPDTKGSYVVVRVSSSVNSVALALTGADGR
jgi:hypothetical protein